MLYSHTTKSKGYICTYQTPKRKFLISRQIYVCKAKQMMLYTSLQRWTVQNYHKQKCPIIFK